MPKRKIGKQVEADPRVDHVLQHLVRQILVDMGYRNVGNAEKWLSIIQDDLEGDIICFGWSLADFFAKHPFDPTGETYIAKEGNDEPA